MIHLNISIYGRVQGVFFRSNTQQEAEKLNIKGFVENQSDGSVYIEAEGEKENLDAFLKWCHQGPSFAQVEKVEVSQEPLKDYKGFEIL